MKYERFEQHPAWIQSIELAELIYDFTEQANEPFKAKTTLKSELEKAGVSASSAIAKGYEKGNPDLFVSQVKEARASVRVIRSILCLIEQFQAFQPYRSMIFSVKTKAEECSMHLSAVIECIEHPDSAISHLERVKEEERRKADKERQAQQHRALFEDLRQRGN